MERGVSETDTSARKKGGGGYELGEALSLGGGPPLTPGRAVKGRA